MYDCDSAFAAAPKEYTVLLYYSKLETPPQTLLRVETSQVAGFWCSQTTHTPLYGDRYAAADAVVAPGGAVHGVVEFVVTVR